MLRLRRSRIVLFLALITSVLFYNLYTKSQAYEWAKTVATRPGGFHYGGGAAKEEAKPAGQDGAGVVPNIDAKPTQSTVVAPANAGLVQSVTVEQKEEATPTPAPTASKEKDLLLDLDTAEPPKPSATKLPVVNIDPEALGKALGGPPTYIHPESLSSTASTTTSATTTDVHWSKFPEHFPVPTASIISLPTAKAKALNKVQSIFKDEPALEKGKREKRQASIVETFKKSWNGYVKYAWMHDELSPKTGKFRDPFCGWAATLVDALDTLIIMGLDEEFKEAVDALGQIDFTTTTRQQIPVFETTIRYLGGLLSAYDLSGQKHKILLDKAVELAEVLMGAFDTPNRMPQTYYSWRPAFVMNPHRASTRVVMAELGSLSMEFTRLAQVTGEDKYYDAIARITNEMEKYQDKSTLPGLWPLYLDASGCRKPDSTHQQNDFKNTLESALRNFDEKPIKQDVTTTVMIIHQGGAQHIAEPKETPAPKFDHQANKGRIGGWDDKEVDRMEAGKVPTRHGDGPVIGVKQRRQLDSAPVGVPVHDHDVSDANRAAMDGFQANAKLNTAPAKVDCLPQGLESPPGAMSEDFSFSGMADSTYEYLPKQFALLGGLVPQYKSMYEKSIEAANKWLLFRPMTPTNEKILVLGKGKAAKTPAHPSELNLVPELGHLLCFAGGMYGLGSKLFDRAEDLEIAKEMTDACVWAYGITPTGIMPEGMDLIPCDDIQNCKWNQTEWEDIIDPYPEKRVADGLVAQERLMENKLNAPPVGPNHGIKSTMEGERNGGVRRPQTNNHLNVVGEKRQLDNPATEGTTKHDSDVDKNTPIGVLGDSTLQEDAFENKNGRVTTGGPAPSKTSPEDARVFSHAEYVEWRMQQNHLPKGVPSMSSRKYILRPEAIESVFYMYRITGDASWREKGWKMWEAVRDSTDTTYGASAILDVTVDPEDVTPLDEMESFWLAETLKYFYLLFADEDVVNLDEWVLNTEAHPFRRPKA